MLKDVKDFFTGGEDIEQARAVIRELEKRQRLSQINKDRLESAKRITRRHFLTRTLPATAVATTLTVFGSHKLWDFLVNHNSRPEVVSADAKKAEELRHQIRDFEISHYNLVTDENLSKLANLIPDLYTATFGRKTLPRRLVVVKNEFFKDQGIEQAMPSVPVGDAGIVQFLFDQNNNVVGVQDIPVIIFLGDPQVNDPEINKLSVFRALIMHEFVHSQTMPGFVLSEVSIGNEKFRPSWKRGLKWNLTFTTRGKDLKREDAKAWYFEEVNTQLLTEYLNDPTGRDDLFINMMKSPVYRHSLAPNYSVGLSFLKKIYEKLGVSITEVEQYHFNAQPKELLERIDRELTKRGVILSEPASSMLIKIDAPDPQTDEGLESLKGLAAKLD